MVEVLLTFGADADLKNVHEEDLSSWLFGPGISWTEVIPVGKISRLVYLKKSPNNWSPEKHHHIPNLYFWVQNVNNCRVAARGTPCQRFAKSPRPKNTTPEVMETHLRAWKSNKFWRMLPRCSQYFRWKTNWIFFQGLENTPWNLQKSWVVISHSSSKPRISDLKKGSALLVLRGCHSRSCFKQVFRGVLRMVLGTALFIVWCLRGTNKKGVEPNYSPEN